MSTPTTNIGALLGVALEALAGLKANGSELSLARHQHVILMHSLLSEMTNDIEVPTGSKLVTYFGRAYLVPDAAQFIATDDDGTTCAYFQEPFYDIESDGWLVATNYHYLGERRDIEAATSLVEL